MVVGSTVVDMACAVVVAEHPGVELGSVGRPEIIICMFGSVGRPEIIICMFGPFLMHGKFSCVFFFI